MRRLPCWRLRFLLDEAARSADHAGEWWRELLLEETAMRIAALIARILLGLAFLLFGLNGFLNFLHQPPPPAGPAAEFLGSLAHSHMFLAISAVELGTALLLLAGVFVPLALTLLGPVIAVILLFHVFMEPGGIAPGLVAFVLWLVVFVRYRENFAGIFVAR